MKPLEYEEIAPQGPHRATVVWLHGIGQVPGDLTAVAERLRLAEAGVRGVFPRAPVTAPSLLTGLPVPCWFPQSVLALDRIDTEGLFAALGPLGALLTAETERIGAGRTVVAGFSQGATVALSLALGHPEPLAGTALYAPYLPSDLTATLPGGRPGAANARLPVWIGHGARDWIVPERSGAGLRDLLTDWGHPVTWQRYPGGHEPFAGVKASLPDFLARVLDTPVPGASVPTTTAPDTSVSAATAPGIPTPGASAPRATGPKTGPARRAG
ncbi:alpha/beta hydrolase [Streptomyces sp. NPDC096013]|uniref:alpha/beta hydrolase n=1 Tax=Streptomyces sp. NPDC096013 TaxID=3366069 RepID=UPI0037FA3415